MKYLVMRRLHSATGKFQSVVFWIVCMVAVCFPCEGRASDSLTNWELKPGQSLHVSVAMNQNVSQSVADRIATRLEAIRQEMIREGMMSEDDRYLADDGTWRSGPRPVPLSSTHQFELKVEMDRFVVTYLDSVTPPPPVPPRPEDWPEEKPWPPPRPPEPKQKWDIAAGIIGGAFWEIQTASRSIMFNTNMFETFHAQKELGEDIDTPITHTSFIRRAKNLGFQVFPGRLNWSGDTFEGVDCYGAVKGKVRRSADGRVLSAYYDSENGFPGRGFSNRVLLEYTYPEDDPQTWIPKSFTEKLLRLDDEGLPEESDFLNEISHTFVLEKFEIREEPFPDSDFDPLTYYVGDTNQLRYEFISGNVTNYFSVVEDERQRRAEAWRKKMIRNRIVFGVILGFFGVVIYFAIYGSPWKQWKRWRSGKGWWP